MSISDLSKQCVAATTTCRLAQSMRSAPERLSASSRSNALFFSSARPVQTRAHCHSLLLFVILIGMLHTNENEGGIMAEGPRLSRPPLPADSEADSRPLASRDFWNRLVQRSPAWIEDGQHHNPYLSLREPRYVVRVIYLTTDLDRRRPDRGVACALGAAAVSAAARGGACPRPII